MKNQKLINKILGCKLMQDRREKKLSLRKVNAKVGISQQMLFKIENGETAIFCGYLYVLSSFYEKPIDDYFTYLIQELKKYENKD